MEPLPENLSRIGELYLGAGILEKWHPKVWADFTGDQPAKDAAQLYVSTQDVRRKEGVGQLYWGPNGTGKTLLLNLVFKDLLRLRLKVRIISFTTVVRAFTQNWRGEGNWGKLLNADVLGIEELDKSFKASAVSLDLVQSALDALLRYRVQRMKPTFGTTNLDPGEFSNVFGKSITSLFKEAMQSVYVPGSDFRDGVFDERHQSPASERPTAPGNKLW